MPLQQALSRHGEVELIQADMQYYWSAFNEIVERLEEISPLVEGSELGCAYIGLDGLQMIYPDDNTLISAVRRSVRFNTLTSESDGFDIRVGIAEGKFPAYLAAMYAGETRHGMSFDGGIEAFLKDLPCDVLPIPTSIKSKLQDFGIHTLGQLRTLSPGPLQAQFGPEGKRILNLARGYDDTPLYHRSMEETIEESTTLSSVTVSIEAIVTNLESMLSRTFNRDSMKGRGIRSLTIWTRTWNGTHWERMLHFKELAIDTKSALLRIKLILETYPQPGPVEQVGLKITSLGYGYGRQGSLFSEVRAQDHLMDDIKQLEFRSGTPQVFKLREVEPWSRIPERRYALRPLS